MPGEKINFIFDFDSTFVKVEALDELFSIALAKEKNKKEIVDGIKKITALGMEGAITFPESLSRRFKLLSADKKHIKELIAFLKKNISDSIRKNRNFFQKNKDNIYIISGGFEEYIRPVAAQFGIGKNKVLANKFIFDKKGCVLGFDKKRMLAKNNGKVKAVKKLGIKGEIWIIGDGYTDYQIRELGVANKFIAYCENVRREKVAKKADQIVCDFDEFLLSNNLK